jgi:hypothetical protein
MDKLSTDTVDIILSLQSAFDSFDPSHRFCLLDFLQVLLNLVLYRQIHLI